MMENSMTAPRTDLRGKVQGYRKPVRPMHCDVREFDDRYELSLELPGFRREDIKISMKDGYMTIQAEHPKMENDNGRILRSERYAGPYGRTFYVGTDIDEVSASAAYENGILKISLRKVQKVPTTIEIK
jgi:HSP20 family molecular chaperone IbpA